MKVLGQIKPRFSFYWKINFRKIASNKHVHLRKIESFVRSKHYPEDISKDKDKKANFRKSWKNFKIVDRHLTYKVKWRVLFDNDSKLLITVPLCLTIIQFSFLTFQLQSKPLKYLYITIPYFLLFPKKFKEYCLRGAETKILKRPKSRNFPQDLSDFFNFLFFFLTYTSYK